MKKFFFLTVISCVCLTAVFGQRIPSLAENIEYLVTFSKDSPKSWGDDDFTQVYFISIAKGYDQPFYIRVFDADVGGMHDAPNGSFDSQTSFSIYGGVSAYSNKASREVNPTGNFESGVRIFDRRIGQDEKYDNNWMTIGPLNPKEGEFDAALDAYVFKFVIKGLNGNDGNLYNFFISKEGSANKEVPGANAFCYELSFRVPNAPNKIPHLYPFIDEDVISVRIHNFDFDNGGGLRVTSVAKNKHEVKQSGDDNWVTSEHAVVERERNTSYDIHILNAAKFSNDMTIFITNQYDEVMPFFSKPINGVPMYKYRVGSSIEER